jgi:hypothetical protein
MTTHTRHVIPTALQRAFIAWLTGDAYRDGAGDYRFRSLGDRLAPWNAAIRALYPSPLDFDHAADLWLSLWEAVPTARLREPVRRRGRA